MRTPHAPLAVGALVALAVCGGLCAAPLTPARISELCAQAEGPAHCGRLIEAAQLKALPDLAVREGNTLRVLLFPSGTRTFVDVDSVQGGVAWALWDYWSPVNIVVLFTTDGERMGYATLQRATNQLTALSGEPVLAPDRQRLVTADFCRENCDNEVAVWRILRDGLRKEMAWKPAMAWSDVTVRWKDAETLTLEFTPEGEDKARTAERPLTAADWRHEGSRIAP
jgi:hypothetical protein